jgi:excisionase family DNA binding protein
VVQNSDRAAEQLGRQRSNPHRPAQPGGRRGTKQAQRGERSVLGPVAYDVPEVLRRLGVTRPTIYRFLRSGELRSFRLGSRRLVSAEALADFIRSRESAEAG